MLPSVAGQKYVPVAVNFDGSNDWLTRDADLTGAADGKVGSISFWFKGAGTSQYFIANATGVAGATFRFRVFIGGGGGLQILGRNAAGTNILLLGSSGVINSGAWTSVVASWDLTDTNKRHIYIGDVSDLIATTYTDDTIDYAAGGDWSMGSLPDAAGKLNGDIADLLLWPTYLDLSVTANRRLFISSSGKPVNPGSAIRQLGVPLVGLYGPLAAWHTNRGSGGGFTLHGALSAASTNPAS